MVNIFKEEAQNQSVQSAILKCMCKHQIQGTWMEVFNTTDSIIAQNKNKNKFGPMSQVTSSPYLEKDQFCFVFWLQIHCNSETHKKWRETTWNLNRSFTTWLLWISVASCGLCLQGNEFWDCIICYSALFVILQSDCNCMENQLAKAARYMVKWALPYLHYPYSKLNISFVRAWKCLHHTVAGCRQKYSVIIIFLWISLWIYDFQAPSTFWTLLRLLLHLLWVKLDRESQKFPFFQGKLL